MKKNEINIKIFIPLAVIVILMLILAYTLGRMQSVEIKDSLTQETSIADKVLKEITPAGTPDYGKKAGVSYDEVEKSLNILRQYSQLTLNAEEMKRYEKIADTEGTPCKYCCGASKLSQNCACSHNIALRGLVKWLIKNTEYSDEEILQEIKKWQILFFPKPTLQEELDRRGISLEKAGLKSMVGGC